MRIGVLCRAWGYACVVFCVCVDVRLLSLSTVVACVGCLIGFSGCVRDCQHVPVHVWVCACVCLG